MFPDIIGHTTQCRQLSLLARKKTTPHALLFSGPAGIGKRSIALRFAALLLSETLPQGQDNNGSLDSSFNTTTQLIRAGTHPDLHLVSKEPGKKDITVDAVRNLRSKLQLKPYFGNCSVAVIDNAHEMNLAASNALLMTLEEPPGACFLILVTDSTQRLPETIISRCQLLHFGELQEEDLLRILTRLLEGIVTEDSQLKALAALGDSSLNPLALEPYLNPLTLKVENKKGISNHLKEITTLSHRLEQQINELLERSDDLSYAVSLATHLAADKDASFIVWHIIRKTLRNKLRSVQNEAPLKQAEALLESIKAEQLVRERNTNLQLQLSSVLLQAAR